MTDSLAVHIFQVALGRRFGQQGESPETRPAAAGLAGLNLHRPVAVVHVSLRSPPEARSAEAVVVGAADGAIASVVSSTATGTVPRAAARTEPTEVIVISAPCRSWGATDGPVCRHHGRRVCSRHRHRRSRPCLGYQGPAATSASPLGVRRVVPSLLPHDGDEPIPLYKRCEAFGQRTAAAQALAVVATTGPAGRDPPSFCRSLASAAAPQGSLRLRRVHPVAQQGWRPSPWNGFA
mmetsp:Transcript_57484/g.186738  ORF Transcript_57484/g.186738 Transcript_57484/m.186738 type:complete len:236 (+) Transcript_57484:2556-3263(+)